jgi:hypothetical protein
MGWVVKVRGKHSVRYEVACRDANRRIRYKTFARRREADAHAAHIENSKNLGSYFGPRPGANLFGGFRGTLSCHSHPPTAIHRG